MSLELDDLFHAAAQRAGGIKPLLTEFFSFLHRRTDFYVVDPSPTRPMGFAEGVAERMVLLALRSLPFKEVPAAAIHIPGPSSKVKLKVKPTAPGALQSTTSALTAVPAPAPAPVAVSSTAFTASSLVSSASAIASASTGPVASAAAPDIPSIRYTAEGKQVPVGNGGVGPGYSWTQTLTEATVYLEVPPGTAGKSVLWEVTPTRVSVRLKTDPPGSPALLEGVLGGAVRAADSMWALEEGRTLVLSFDKAVRTWWGSVVAGHPLIDATQVDSTQRVEEYDPETQGALRKIMFEQSQKARGLAPPLPGVPGLDFPFPGSSGEGGVPTE